ncbi:MAG: tetratricopeptide repeat protein [Cyanobacteria bacterium P01_A01_bin.114]
MPVRISLNWFPLLLLLGICIRAQPARAQALLPYTLPLDEARLQADGLSLASDAAQLAQFQQYDEALARAQLAAQLAPNEPDVLSLLGSLYLQLGQTEPAIAVLERAQQLDRDNPLVWFALGSAYFGETKYLRAAAALEKGLELEPENPGAHFDLGNTYYKLSRYPQAIEQYEVAVSYDDSFWPAVNNIGLVLYETGDTAGAIEKWRESLTISNGEAEPQLAIAVALHTQGTQTDEAIRTATEALERDSRYADLDFLKENLWGERLLSATRQFFETPALQDLLVQL